VSTIAWIISADTKKLADIQKDV